MTDYEVGLRRLRLLMVVTGIGLIVLVPFGFSIWPAGFQWGHPHGHPAYERMIVAIYAALGICLLVAARDPVKNVSIIDFTILSSIFHGAVMAYDSFAQHGEMTHLIGDVPLLFGMAGLFVWLHPRRLALLPGAPAAG